MSREPVRAELGKAAPLTSPEIRLACLRAALELRNGASTRDTIMADADAFCAFAHLPVNQRWVAAARPMVGGDLGIDT